MKRYVRWIGCAAGAIVLLSALLLYLRFQFGSCAAAIEFLRGREVLVHPEKIDIGAGKPGETREVQLCVRNIGFHDAELVGYSSDCACVATDRFPLLLRPRESLHLGIRVGFPNGEQAFTRKIAYFRPC